MPELTAPAIELDLNLERDLPSRLGGLARAADLWSLGALAVLGVAAWLSQNGPEAAFATLACVAVSLMAALLASRSKSSALLWRCLMACGHQALAMVVVSQSAAFAEFRSLPLLSLAFFVSYRDWRVVLPAYALNLVCVCSMVAAHGPNLSAPAWSLAIAVDAVVGAALVGSAHSLRLRLARETQLEMAAYNHAVQLQNQLEATSEENDELSRTTQALQEIRAHLEAELAARQSAESALQEKNEQLEQSRLRAETQARDLAQKSAMLSEARDAALEAARAKAEFLARMSHELRTPLNGVLGVLQILEPLSDPESRRLIQIAAASGKSLLEIINNLLDYSKMEAGQIVLESIEFNLIDLALEVLGLFEEPSSQKSLALNLVVSPNVPEYVCGDPVRVRQLLLNLVGNAVKFTSEGSVTLRLLPANPGEILAEVQDTGIGIPRDRLEHVFGVFVQAEPDITRQYGGTGLGLAICRQICDAMGANIDIESEVGVGTCVRLGMPLTAARHATSNCDAGDAEGNVWAIACCPGTVESLRIWSSQLGFALREFDELSDAILVGAKDGWPETILISGERYPVVPGWLASGHCPSRIVAVARASHAPALLEPGRYASTLGTPIDPRQILGAISPPEAQASSDKGQENDLAPVLNLGLTILLAEDNDVNAMVTTRILQRWGCQTEVVSDGEQALEVFRSRRFDAILLDVQMPMRTGVEVAREIRREERDSGLVRVVIIGLTADVLATTHRKCLDAGMDEVLTKPLDTAQLLSLLMDVDPHRRAA